MTRLPLISLLIISLWSCSISPIALEVDKMRINEMSEMNCLDKTPFFSWTYHFSEAPMYQSAYEIEVTSDTNAIDPWWNSGKVESIHQRNIKYQGVALESGLDYYWRVKVWDKEGQESVSRAMPFHTCFYLDSLWQAQWIGYDDAIYSDCFGFMPWNNDFPRRQKYRPLPSPYFRKDFTVKEELRSARVYVSAKGLFDLNINGRRVSADYFLPGWTNYHKRIYYYSYEVKDIIESGDNALGVILGDGWYAGNVANRGQNIYGSGLRLKLQLELTYKDGSSEMIKTNEDWTCSYGPIRRADFQSGETYDANFENEGWDQAGFDDQHWEQVDTFPDDKAIIEAYPMLPIRPIAEIKPKWMKYHNGGLLVNMGQNFAGWLDLTFSIDGGDSLVVKHAEWLNEDSTLYDENLRSAHQMDVFVGDGSGQHRYQPRFTYHGFQYALIEGFTEIDTASIRGIAVMSEMEQAGDFACSDQMLNRIHENVLWSLVSNFMDVPTDNPQRDERMGWSGDAQIIMPTASYMFRTAPFMRKYLQNMVDDQFDNGCFPSTAPMIYKREAAGWGDAGVIIPSELFHFYGDSMTMRKMWPNMKAHVDHMNKMIEGGLSTKGSFGDWQAVNDTTDISILSTYYTAKSNYAIGVCGNVLNKESAESYLKQFQKATKLVYDAASEKKNPSRTEFLMKNDLLGQHNQSVDDVTHQLIQSDTSIQVGFHGAALLLPHISNFGFDIDAAFKLAVTTNFPSWGYDVEQGATTIWERWDAFNREHPQHPPHLNSLNQYAFGSIGEWIYRDLSGIDWKVNNDGGVTVNLTPRFPLDLDALGVQYEVPSGVIKLRWERQASTIKLEIEVPPNTECKFHWSRELYQLKRKDEPVVPEKLEPGYHELFF